MSNKPTFDANMRFMRYSSSDLRELDDLVYTHRDITGETPDEIRALMYAYAEQHFRSRIENATVPLPVDAIRLRLQQRAADYQKRAAKIEAIQEGLQQRLETGVGRTQSDADAQIHTDALETPQRANPVDKPTLVDVHLSIGGSHKQYNRDTAALKRAGIAFRYLGPVAYRSKYKAVAIAAEDWEQAKALGLHKARRQPQPLKGE